MHNDCRNQLPGADARAGLRAPLARPARARDHSGGGIRRHNCEEWRGGWPSPRASEGGGEYSPPKYLKLVVSSAAFKLRQFRIQGLNGFTIAAVLDL